MRTHGSPITWQLHVPSSGDANSEQWLTELWEMRGRVLYQVCGLTEFRLGDGAFADPDPVDHLAFHLVAASRDGLLGCIRAVPLSAACGSIAESLLGKKGLDNLLLTVGAKRHLTFEVSRWFVLPGNASTGVAVGLVSGMWAVLQWLGAHTAIGMAGMRDGQDRMLMRMGGRPAPGLAPAVSTRFGQSIVALWFDIDAPAQPWARLVQTMAATLQLDSSDSRHRHLTSPLKVARIVKSTRSAPSTASSPRTG